MDKTDNDSSVKTNDNNVGTNQITNNNLNTDTTTYEKINFQVVNKKDENENDMYYLKIDDNIVEDIKNPFGLHVEQFKDLLLVIQGDTGSWSGLIVIDKNGSIIGSIGYNNKPSLLVKGKSLDQKNNKIIDGNDIIVYTTNIVSIDIESMCKDVKEYKSKNEPVKYQSKITYLGNGKFSESTILKTISADEYEREMNLDYSKY